MVMNLIGGYGHLAYGRHKFGGADSLDFQEPPQPLGPRFSFSTPLDGANNVPLSQCIFYDLYYYSSSLGVDISNPPSTPPIEISEDAGGTWLDASIAPYTLSSYYVDGQTYRFKIQKASDWTAGADIQIRTTFPDEYGQVATDILPVRWE